MTTTTRPEFTDADLAHRWAAEHRIPLVTCLPDWKYEAALLVPGHAEGESPDPDLPRHTYNLYDAIWPGDDEAAVIGSYIEYRVQHWYNETWQAKMRSRPLDVDSGANTVTFRKKSTGWTYTKATFRDSLFYPLYDQPQHEASKAGLIALITGLHDFGGDGRVYSPFAAWMAEHPDVWSP